MTCVASLAQLHDESLEVGDQQTKDCPKGGPSQHQVSVRREAVHIRAPRFELIKMVQPFLRIGTERGGLPMKRQMISALVTIALVAAATAMQRSPSAELSARTVAMPSLQELHTAAGVNKLPIEEFEDMALVYSTVTKR
jgi:hypothetical protein